MLGFATGFTYLESPGRTAVAFRGGTAETACRWKRAIGGGKTAVIVSTQGRMALIGHTSRDVRPESRPPALLGSGRQVSSVVPVTITILRPCPSFNGAGPSAKHHRAFGVPERRPMDWYALTTANAMVGNAPAVQLPIDAV